MFVLKVHKPLRIQNIRNKYCLISFWDFKILGCNFAICTNIFDSFSQLNSNLQQSLPAKVREMYENTKLAYNSCLQSEQHFYNKIIH